jgi:tetratricopeptide (TPR) repeat protein
VLFGRLVDTLTSLAKHFAWAGRLAEGVRLLRLGEQLLETPDAPATVSSRLMTAYGELLALENFQGTGDFDTTLTTLQRAEALAEQAGDERLRAAAIDATGAALHYRALAQGGGFDAELDCFERALAIREQFAQSDSRAYAETLFHVGLAHEFSGRLDVARGWYERAVSRARTPGCELELSYAVRHLGFVHQRQGDLARARALLAESLELRRRIGFRLFLPFSHLAYGDVCAELGDTQTAREQFEQALAIAREIASPSQTIFALIALGQWQRDHSSPAEATDSFTEALVLAESVGFERGISRARAGMASLGA